MTTITEMKNGDLNDGCLDEAAAPHPHPQKKKKKSAARKRQHQDDDTGRPQPSYETGEEEEEGEEGLLYGAKHVIMLFVPLTLCMTFVVATINVADVYFHTKLLNVALFSEDTSSSGNKLLASFGNAAIVLTVVVVMTCVLLLCYKYECYNAIRGVLVVATGLPAFILCFLYLRIMLASVNVLSDIITMSFVIWNYGVCGVVVIHWKGPLLLQQMYHITISALFALHWIKMLPDWSLWMLLGAISIWDLVAVLCPKGPLRLLVELAQNRNEPLLPGLIYSSTMLYPVIGMADRPMTVDEGNIRTIQTSVPPGSTEVDLTDGSVVGVGGGVTPEEDPNAVPPPSPSQPQQQQEQPTEEEEERGVKLGLGDFVFYSILVGKTSVGGDWNTTLASFLAILIGLSCTLLLLAMFKKALPALPISIFFGLTFYFLSNFIVRPFGEQLAINQVYI